MNDGMGEKTQGARVRPQYISEQEERKLIEKRAEKKRWHNDINDQAKKMGAHMAKPIKVNGVVYSNLNAAAASLGIASNTVRKYYKQLMESCRSSIEVEAMVRRKFEFEKVKQ